MCSLVAFFREVPVVLAKLKPYLLTSIPGVDNLEGALKLREWQETLVSLTILAKKYKVKAVLIPCSRLFTLRGTAVSKVLSPFAGAAYALIQANYPQSEASAASRLVDLLVAQGSVASRLPRSCQVGNYWGPSRLLWNVSAQQLDTV